MRKKKGTGQEVAFNTRILQKGQHGSFEAPQNFQELTRGYSSRFRKVAWSASERLRFGDEASDVSFLFGFIYISGIASITSSHISSHVYTQNSLQLSTSSKG